VRPFGHGWPISSRASVTPAQVNDDEHAPRTWSSNCTYATTTNGFVTSMLSFYPPREPMISLAAAGAKPCAALLASVCPEAATRLGDGVSPAARAAASGSPPGRAAATANVDCGRSAAPDPGTAE
jgi:hypothetical protein